MPPPITVVTTAAVVDEVSGSVAGLIVLSAIGGLMPALFN